MNKNHALAALSKSLDGAEAEARYHARDAAEYEARAMRLREKEAECKKAAEDLRRAIAQIKQAEQQTALYGRVVSQ